jgi:hypothetical protein
MGLKQEDEGYLVFPSEIFEFSWPTLIHLVTIHEQLPGQIVT